VPHEDDGTAAAALVARYPALIDGPDFTSPEDAKSFISGLDFLTAARMHATIAALSSGVPVVPMSYSRKFEGLFGGLGYRWLLPVTGMGTEEAVAYVLDAWDRRSDVKADVDTARARTDALLEPYVAELAAIVGEAAR
jgi:polysaccharide pyruvyl transferase WcaK-like protein